MSGEAIVRSALREHLSASPDRQRQDLIDEFWVPLSHERVDVAVIGSVMQAFEIKTTRDNLKRLPRQVEAFGRIFDHCTAVIAERHVERGLTMVPGWWGVLVICSDDPPSFASLQEPGPNPTVDPQTLVRLLWRDEVQSALLNLGYGQAPQTGRVAMWEELLRVVHVETLRVIVRQALSSRQPTHAGRSSVPFTDDLMATADP